MTSPDPVDINAIATIVRTSIPPVGPRMCCAIKGVTRPIIHYSLSFTFCMRVSKIIIEQSFSFKNM